MDNFRGSFSRRQFLQRTAVVGGALCVGSEYWGALAYAQEIRAPRRFAPNDGLSLAEYITREAPKMEVFPFGLITAPSERFRATLTFKRYLPFFRYKEKVLASTIEEVDDCVSRIKSFGSTPELVETHRNGFGQANLSFPAIR